MSTVIGERNYYERAKAKWQDCQRIESKKWSFKNYQGTDLKESWFCQIMDTTV